MTKTQISAEVILQSKHFITDVVITTFRINCPKFILAEFNTHRALSRSFSSSRAVPAKTMRKNVLQDPVIPVSFGKNQSGMQSKTELSGWRREAAKQVWLLARYPACLFHFIGEQTGLHKQICNRIIEPWVWAEGVVTATELKNFFDLRCHPDAQPEFQVLATAIRDAYFKNIDNAQVLEYGGVHLPFITNRELTSFPIDTLKKISAARCARVSYYLRDGRLSDPDSDIKLCDRLFGSSPRHLSPAEHVAICDLPGRYANFECWRQYRKEVE